MNDNSIRFTLAICSYNIESYIARCINSIKNQTFKNFEIIIVDDCSTDQTLKVIENEIVNERFNVYKTEKNTGTAGGPRNIAIKYAKGEYIIFLDGDDTLYDDKVLENLDRIIGNEDIDLVYLGFEDVGQGNKDRISTSENSTKKARLICDLTFSVSSRCWNINFLRKNNMSFKEGMYYEDEVFSLKATILVEKTKYNEMKLFKYYRNRKGSVMSAPSIKKCSDWYRMLAEIMDLYSITPDIYKPYLLSFIKNENLNIPRRIAGILDAYKKGESIKLFPKRDYKFKDFFEDEN